MIDTPEQLTVRCAQLQHHGGPRIDLLALAYDQMLDMKPWQALDLDFRIYLEGQDQDGNLVTKTLGIGSDGWKKVARAISSLGDERPHNITRSGTQIHSQMVELLDQAGLGKQDHGGDRRSPTFQANNVSLKEGNSREEAIHRLRKDRPDLLARVEAEELTAHAAMVQAGFRPRTITVRADDPGKIAATLRRQLDPETLAAVKDLL